MKSEFILREYRTSDAKDLLESDYPFDDINEFGSWYKDTRLKIIDFLEGRHRKRFVAYSLKEKKVLTTNKIDCITKNLWHNGAIFTVPSYRRRGLTELLGKYVEDYEKRKGATKSVGNIELTNFPSISMAAKRGFKFLPQSYYQCDGTFLENIGVDEQERNEKITLVDSHRSDKDTLHSIYQKCTMEEWRNILEIDKDNFLERFFGWTRMRGLFKLWIRNRVINIKENGDIIGYFHHTTRLLPIKKRRRITLYLYLLPSKWTRNILGKILNALKKDGYEEASIVFLNADRIFMEETADILQNDFQFKKRKFLVFYTFVK
jgi:GNAT superfamily N-acetyltransferase